MSSHSHSSWGMVLASLRLQSNQRVDCISREHLTAEFRFIVHRLPTGAHVSVQMVMPVFLNAYMMDSNVCSLCCPIVITQCVLYQSLSYVLIALPVGISSSDLTSVEGTRAGTKVVKTVVSDETGLLVHTCIASWKNTELFRS